MCETCTPGWSRRLPSDGLTQGEKKGRPLKFPRHSDDLVECLSCSQTIRFASLPAHKVSCQRWPLPRAPIGAADIPDAKRRERYKRLRVTLTFAPSSHLMQTAEELAGVPEADLQDLPPNQRGLRTRYNDSGAPRVVPAAAGPKEADLPGPDDGPPAAKPPAQQPDAPPQGCPIALPPQPIIGTLLRAHLCSCPHSSAAPPHLEAGSSARAKGGCRTTRQPTCCCTLAVGRARRYELNNRSFWPPYVCVRVCVLVALIIRLSSMVGRRCG